MKKSKIFIVALILLAMFTIIGCNKNDDSKKVDTSSSIEKEKNTYIKFVKELKKVKESSEELPFDINVSYDKLDDEEIRYQVVIDNPKVELKEIKALAIHDKQTDDVFPSVGIFDSIVDLSTSSNSKGIILVGYIPYDGNIDDFDCEIKVLISYIKDENKITSYYVTKK
ncbi:MAG: hypothetical protein J6J17_01420 [Bacilli bacterium]|nr:hypothetical protein [Bacilli bacterium]